MKNIMKMEKWLLLCTFLMDIAITSCQKMDGYNTDPVSNDTSKPGVVTNIRVKNFNGGAYIIYDLPASKNILYVQAQYSINPKANRQTKASYYTDTITVDGFAASQDYNVTLNTVSRANILSDGVVVTVHPNTPYYRLIRPTIAMTPDFGGVNITARNPNKTAIGLVLITQNATTNALEIVDQHYTNTDTISYSLRGYQSVPTKFGAYVVDKFGNTSDTLFTTLTPRFEKLLDKSKFFNYPLATDSPIGYGWEVPYLWDGKTDGSSNGWHTNPGAPAPMQCTFGVGASAVFSRFVMWERPDSFTYGHGNPKSFSVWGSNQTSPKDANIPQSAAVGTVVGDWVNLGNFNYPAPPSGLTPPFTNAADEAFVRAGVNFNLAPNTPQTRYFRLIVHSTWSQGDFAHVMEFSIFGQ